MRILKCLFSRMLDEFKKKSLKQKGQTPRWFIHMLLKVGQSGVADRRDADDRLWNKSGTYENFSKDLKERIFNEKVETDYTVCFLCVNIYVVIVLKL